MGLYSVVTLAICFLVLLDGTASRTEPQDIQALIAFRNSFTSFGSSWPLESVDPCENVPLYRFQIRCLPPTEPHFPYRVGVISLSCTGLRGTVPSLANFTALTSVDLSSNFLSGTIANSMFGPRIAVLNLYNNSLSGSVPSFTTATGLQELTLSRNNFQGPIPTNLAAGNLRILSLSSNNLTGTIPSQLFGNVNLNQLFLSNNTGVNGTIPTEVGNLRQAVIISLWRMNLTGTIPTEFGNLNTLRFLYLDRNSLEGSIPSQLGNDRSDLRILYLRENKLNGSIPQTLANLRNLTALSLAINNLTGTLPPALGNLTKLRLLHIYLNPFLNGTIPSSYGNLTALTTLDLSSNDLRGPIPASFAALTNRTSFVFLNLAFNNLDGDLSTSFLATAPATRHVDLRNNLFTCGSQPSWCSKGSGNGYCESTKCLLAPVTTAPRANPITKRGDSNIQSLTLRWVPSDENDDEEDTSYEAEMSESGSNNFAPVYKGKENTATIEGLLKGKIYQFRIRAIQSGSVGPWSPSLEAVVQ